MDGSDPAVGHGVAQQDPIRIVLRDFVVAQVPSAQVVGFVTATSDGVLSAYIPFLEVVPAYRSRGIGSLRENLRRRRVAGSSFANDQIIEAERQFGQAMSESEAASFLEELQANQQILSFESAQIYDALNRELAEAGLATNFGVNMANLFSSNQMFETQLAVSEAQAAGQFVGDILGLGLGLGGQALLSPAGTFRNSELARLLGLDPANPPSPAGTPTITRPNPTTFQVLR